MYLHRGTIDLTPADLYQGVGRHRGPHPIGLDFETFRILAGDSSLSNLPTLFQGVLPFLHYQGKNYDGSTWAADTGPTLSLTGAGDAPVSVSTPLTDDSDKAVEFSNLGQELVAGSSGDGDVSTGNSLIVEIVARTFASATHQAGYIWAADYGTNGWGIYQENGNLTLWMDGTFFHNLGRWSSNSWYHAVFAHNRANGQTRCWQNTIGAATVSSGTTVSDLTHSTPLRLGSSPTFVESLPNQMAWLAAYQGPDLVPADPSDLNDIIKERFIRLCGLYPQLAKGTAIPTTATRDSVAYIDKIDTSTDVVSFYPVGKNWSRLCRRKDLSGNVVTGYLAEEARTNLLPQSEAWAAWTKIFTNVSEDAGVAPDGNATADQLEFTTPADSETYLQCPNANGGASVDGVVFANSVWLKRISGGNQLWLGMTDPTTWTGQQQHKITLTDDWQRFEVVNTVNAPTAGTSVVFVIGIKHQVSPGTDNLPPITVLAWGAQVERANFSSSYIKTAGAAAIRVADDLIYPASGNLGSIDQGSLYYEVLPIDPSSSSLKRGVQLLKNDVSELVNTYMDSNQKFQHKADGGASNTLTAAKSTDASQVFVTWQPGSQTLSRDNGAATDSDNEAAVPDAGIMESIYVGSGIASPLKANGLLSHVRIFKKALPNKVIPASWE